MPRTARVAPKGYIYHVLTRGNNRQDDFREEADFKKYLALLSHYKEKYQFKLYHYVLMTNHVHLVLEPSESGGRLSEIMKGINLSYVLYYKKKNHYSGHFWQDRFKSILISRDEYLLACGSYVELNPVRARMVDDPKDYPWSSYRVHAYGRKNDLVDEHPVYSLLSEEERHRQKNYREFVRGMLKAKDGMKGEMDRRMAYGGEDFLKKMAAAHHIAELIRQRGRQKEWRKNK
jgi:putative transposase